tara:strand:+ start:174 stop:431 length:258 start_codon:yes stop_codon:yes gene_type:complete
MKKDKNLHKIVLVDWYEAIQFLGIENKLKDYIITKKISESKAKLLGITDREVYLAKKEVFMRKPTSIVEPFYKTELSEMIWAMGC